MATPLSEVIPYLSFDGDILEGEEFETIKVLLQEFGSMSVVINPSANVSLAIQFSNDGTNFDTSNNYSISSSGQTITSVILGKWARLRIINTVKQTVNVRMSTFAQVIPIAIQSQLESEGDIYPSVNIDNLTSSLWGDLRTVKREPVQEYSFQYYTASAGTLIGPDRDLGQFTTGGLVLATSPATVSGSTVCLSNIYNAPLNGVHYIQGDDVAILAGNAIYTNIACGFNLRGYSFPNNGYDCMLAGIGYVEASSGDIVDGVYVGYPETPSSPGGIVDEFCFVVYFNKSNIIIPKSEWLFDSLDGNGPSRITLDPTKLSSWRMRTSISSSVYLEYKNPLDNLWIPCHRVQVENLYTTPLLANPSLAFSLYTKRTTNSVGSPLQFNGCGPYSSRSVVGFEAGEERGSKLQTYSFYNEVTIPAGVEGEVFSLRNGPLFNGFTNRTNVRLDSIYVSTFVRRRPAHIKLYKNGLFLAPLWVDQDPVRDCIQSSTSSYVIGTGYQVKGLLVSGDSTIKAELAFVDTELSPLETLSITSQCVNQHDVSVVVNYSLLL